MKKLFTIFFFLLISSIAFSQIPGKESHEPYTAENGKVLKEGDKLFLGSGTLPNGDFKYIYMPPNVLTSTLKSPLKSEFSSLSLPIKFFKIMGSKRAGYKTIAVINPGGFNHMVDLEQAIKAGEVVFED